MLCQICEERPATIHTIDIVNNKKSERHICETCYKEQGLANPLSIPEIKASLPIKPPSAADLEDLAEMMQSLGLGKAGGTSCPNCGIRAADLKKNGLVGCQTCYDTFATEIERLVAKLHGAREHRGKVPRAVEAERARRHQAALLQDELARAIGEERFEEAASLRDRIRALEESSTRGSESMPSEGERHD